MWRKGEIARNEQFLLFQQCFPSVWRTFSHFLQVNKKKKKWSSANASTLEEFRNRCLGKG